MTCPKPAFSQQDLLGELRQLQLLPTLLPVPGGDVCPEELLTGVHAQETGVQVSETTTHGFQPPPGQLLVRSLVISPVSPAGQGSVSVCVVGVQTQVLDVSVQLVHVPDGHWRVLSRVMAPVKPAGQAGLSVWVIGVQVQVLSSHGV